MLFPAIHARYTLLVKCETIMSSVRRQGSFAYSLHSLSHPHFPNDMALAVQSFQCVYVCMTFFNRILFTRSTSEQKVRHLLRNFVNKVFNLSSLVSATHRHRNQRKRIDPLLDVFDVKTYSLEYQF